MLLSTNQAPKIMPKIRCPKCEKSNLYLKNCNTLYCPECDYTLQLLGSQVKLTPNS